MDRRDFLLHPHAGLFRPEPDPAQDATPAGAGTGDVATTLPARVLGATGRRVPVLGLGTAAMGRGLEDDEASALIEQAIDLGVTYVDTAPAIGGYGRAQLQVGAVMQARRQDVFLVTKCYEPDGGDARRLLESSLRELQTDRVDLVLVHSIGRDRMDPELVFGPAGAMRALIRARDEGLARHIGVSGHNRPTRFLRAIREFPLDVVMTAANFVDAHTYGFESAVWPAARRRNIGLVAMKVFGGPLPGTSGPALLPASLHDLAFRYTLSLEGCVTAVIGMTDREQLAQNVDRARRLTPLSPEELAELRSTGATLAREWGPHLGDVG